MKSHDFAAIAALCLWPVFFKPIMAAEQQHSQHTAHEKHENEQSLESDSSHHVHGGHTQAVSFSAEQIMYAGIQTQSLMPSQPDTGLQVAGEVKQNGYTSFHVSPRVDSVVLKRHVALGEHVEKGQALVTLFSETVAEAQAAYVDSYTEWQRIKGIGPGSVSDKRIKESQTAYHAAIGRLRAYGLSMATIRSLNVESQNLGEYTLRAESDGTVLADDFNQGQRVMAGEEIMQIADESLLWVEARLPPGNRIELPSADPATVIFDQQRYPAKVAQEAHTIDPVTRTRIVRLLVDNQSHQLHPGMFVDVLLQQDSNQARLMVPETALSRGGDGDWQVFIEIEANTFVAREVERLAQHGDMVAISGIEAGTEVVMSGAFFIASQIAKGGFDPHNH